MFDAVLGGFVLAFHFPRPEDEIIRKLFDPNINGPLVSLTNKARLAYALGLIDKTLESDFEQIHNIRNKFAHNGEADFANTEVTKLVKKLSTAKGKQVTANNSYTFYGKAVEVCREGTAKALSQVMSKQLKLRRA